MKSASSGRYCARMICWAASGRRRRTGEPRTNGVGAGRRRAQQGVTIREGVEVLNILQQAGHATGVETESGTIQSEVVVLCGGMWTREVGIGGHQHPFAPGRAPLHC